MASITRLGFIGFSLIIIIYLFDLLLRTVRWQILLKNQGYSSKSIPLKTLFFPISASLIINLFTIARAGEISRMYILKKEKGVTYSDSLSTIAMEQSLSIFGLLVIVLMGLTSIGNTLIQDLDDASSINLLVIIFSILSIVLLLFLVFIMLYPDLFTKIISFFPKSIGYRINRLFLSFYKGLVNFKTKKVQLFFALILSTGIWFIEGILLYIIASSLFPIVTFIDLPWIIAASCLGNITFILPILPGAIGEYEVIVSIILLTSPSHLSDVGVVAFIDRIVKTLVLGILGIPTIIKFGGKELLSLKADSINKNEPKKMNDG